MTDSTTDPASDSPPPNVQINFRDDLTQPGSRRAVERSVATLLARSAEAVAQARAAQAERAKLEAALNAPFMRLIEEDPEAIEALDTLRTRQLLDLDSTRTCYAGSSHSCSNDVLTVPLREARVLVRVPPYDFSWSWFRPA